MSIKPDLGNKLPIQQIHFIPDGADRRLIDVGLLHYEASLAGYAERYKHGETTHTIHVWWARRPHIAMRILAFASLCKDYNAESIAIMENLSGPYEMRTQTLMKAREIINQQYSKPPKVLDMFSGGGTIPFEVANIGAKAYSIDANELSVFIQKCNLVYSQSVDLLDIGNIVKQSGINVLHYLEKHTAKLFPLRKINDGKSSQLLFSNLDESIPFGYIWTYSIHCPNCGYRFYLSKRPWLSKKNGRRLAIIFENDKDNQLLSMGDVPNSYKIDTSWLGKNGKAKCPNCNYLIEKVNIKDTQDKLVAIIKATKGKGKDFLIVDEDAKIIPQLTELHRLEKEIIQELNCELPKSQLPKWSGIVNPAIYGVETYSDFMNDRQRLVLLMLIKSLLNEYEILKKDVSENTAKFVISSLSSMIDQLIDWNCRLSMWIPQNEQVGRAFCGPGVPMLWDYVETDPVLTGPANLWSKLNRIVDGVNSIGKFPYRPIVKHAFAQKLPFDNNTFDAIITDPPYYDNIYYSILSNFIYTWKRIILKKIDPELFSRETTDSKHELVASTFRNSEPDLAHEEYCKQLNMAIKEASRVLKSNGLIAFIYSHSSLNGWEAIVKSFRESNLVITSVQPLSIERKHRPRSMFSEAINICIVFIARKTEYQKEESSIDDILNELSEIAINYSSALKEAGWQDNDIALSIMASGVAYLSNHSNIIGVKSNREALKMIESKIHQNFKRFKIKDRNPL